MITEFGEVLEKENLKKYSTFGIGGTCKYLIKPDSKIHLIGLINYLNKNKIKYLILGNGSNVIIEDGYFDGVVIKLDNFNNIEFLDNDRVKVGAGLMLPVLAKKCLDNGYVNLNFASMIPGTVGGSVVGNAGAYGFEIMESVESVIALDKEGNVKELKKDDISFGYRYTSLKDKYLILEIIFKLNKGDVELAKNEAKERNEKRIASQPLDKKSVGSIFRNPEGDSAGRLIDSLGLKGYSKGGAKISEKHANFIVNESGASFDDVVTLINEIKEKVKKEYNINLVCEPTIIKWNEL